MRVVVVPAGSCGGFMCSCISSWVKRQPAKAAYSLHHANVTGIRKQVRHFLTSGAQFTCSTQQPAQLPYCTSTQSISRATSGNAALPQTAAGRAIFRVRVYRACIVDAACSFTGASFQGFSRSDRAGSTSYILVGDAGCCGARRTKRPYRLSPLMTMRSVQQRLAGILCGVALRLSR